MSLEIYRLLALRGALKIEVKTGLKHSWAKPAEQVREILGVRTLRKAKLLEQYEAWLKENGYVKAA